MRNMIMVGIACIALLGLLNTLSDNRPSAQSPAVQQYSQPGVVVLDGTDPFFNEAGSLALLALAVLVGLIIVKGPHRNSTTTRQTAIIAAIVLRLCTFLLSWLFHSGQADIWTQIADIL